MRERETRSNVPQEASLRNVEEHTMYAQPAIFKDEKHDTPSAKNLFTQREEDVTSIFVPEELKKAGKLLREARERHFVEAGEVAYVMSKVKQRHITQEDIKRFEEGKETDTSLPKIITAAEKYIDPEDSKIQELQKIAGRREEQKKWLWLLEQDGQSIGDTVKCIRLSEGDAQAKFAHKLSISEITVNAIELSGRKPLLATIDEMLTKTGFEDEQQKVAQRIRLKVCEIDPVSIKSFEEGSFGENIRYLRVQKGFTQEVLGKLSGGKSLGWVSTIERNVKTPTKESRKDLFDVLAISNEMREFMEKKSQGENPKLSLQQQADLLENYYFLEDSAKEQSSLPFTKEDQRLSERVKKAENFGEGLRMVREELDLTRRDLGKDRSYISRLELGKKIPEDFVIADLVKTCGFSIVDKTSQSLIALAEKDRKKRGGRHI